MFGVGLIGAGAAGHAYAVSVSDLSVARLVGVYDTNPGAAARLARKYDRAAYSGPKELLADPQVDVIVFGGRTASAGDLVNQAAQQGKHVLCDASFVESPDLAREAQRSCAQGGVRFMLGSVIRFHPAFRRARELISHGVIGTPTVVQLNRRNHCPQSSGASNDRTPVTKHVVMSIIPDFDWLQLCFGTVSRIHARTAHARAATHDGARLGYTTVILRFASGVIAQVSVHTSQAEGAGHQHATLEIAGTGGVLRHDSRESAAVQSVTRQLGPHSAIRYIDPLSRSPHTAQLSAFLDSLQTDTAFPVHSGETLAAMEMGVGVLESLQTGEPATPEPLDEREEGQL